jgi:hypothetical protein
MVCASGTAQSHFRVHTSMTYQLRFFHLRLHLGMIKFEHFPTLDKVECCFNLANHCNMSLKRVVESSENDQTKRAASHRLLSLDALISGKDYDKSRFFGFIQQIAVFEVCPSHSNSASYFVAW